MKLPDDVLECVRLVQAGVERDENFRQVFVAFAPRLRRFFSRRGCRPEESQDLTQETFVRVYKGLKAYRGDVEFAIWLYQIARNVLSNARRHAGAQKRRGDHMAVPLGTLDTAGAAILADGAGRSSTALDPLYEILAKRRMAAIREAIDALPPQMRRCLVLRVYQERSYEEIAAILELSIDTVKSHLLQARRRLRQSLEAEDLRSVRQTHDLGDEA